MNITIVSRLPHCFVLLFLALLLGLPTAAGGEEYRYQVEKKGAEPRQFTWTIESGGQDVTIRVHKGNVTTVSTCSRQGVGPTSKWKMDNGLRSSYTAVREKNILNITGSRDGEPYENAAGLDDKPWLQDLFYSLSKFVATPHRDISFWTIPEGDIEPTVLTARKRGRETIEVGGQPVKALKVEVRSNDFFDKFTVYDYWFREGDNRLVKFRYEPGLPGNYPTVTTLVGGGGR